jgi:hypothetical protein
LNCQKCGKEVLDEKSAFCAYCGVPFDSQSKNNSDFLNSAGILTTIAAAFTVAAGFVGITTYQSYLAYYTAYSMDAPGVLGFLFFAAFAFVASIFGFAAAMFSLRRKRFKLAVVGTVLMCASVIFTLVVVWYYGLGYSDGIMVSGVPTLALSLVSTFLLVKSKGSFADYTAGTVTSEAAETPNAAAETSEIDESIWKE